MKNFIVLLAFLLVSLTVRAENWVMIQESNDGLTRLLMQTDSFSVVEDAAPDGTNTYFVASYFRFVTDGVLKDAFIYVTPLASCKSKNGLIYMRVQEGKNWKTLTQNWWSGDGTKLYDSAGTAMCRLLELKFPAKKSEK